MFTCTLGRHPRSHSTNVNQTKPLVELKFLTAWRYGIMKQQIFGIWLINYFENDFPEREHPKLYSMLMM